MSFSCNDAPREGKGFADELDELQKIDALKAKVNTAGQGHLLDFYSDLDPPQQTALQLDIQSIDFQGLRSLFDGAMNRYAAAEARNQAVEYSPPSLVDWSSNIPLDDVFKDLAQSPCSLTRADSIPKKYQELMVKRGLELIATGRAACVIMAGGQGTRLGFDGPKGAMPVAPLSGSSLFRIFSERLIRLQLLASADPLALVERVPVVKFGGTKSTGNIPLFIMTADHNHEATVSHFEKNHFFGLGADQVFFFRQATIPCLDLQGNVLLEKKHLVARSPNGNGGVFQALLDTGMLAVMEQRGVTCMHVCGVDNILCKVMDPLFLGYCNLAQAQVGNKCITRLGAKEKVGVFCSRLEPARATNECTSATVPLRPVACVVEYTELPDTMKEASDEHQSSSSSCSSSSGASASPLSLGQQLTAGNIAQHYFSLAFVRSLVSPLCISDGERACSPPDGLNSAGCASAAGGGPAGEQAGLVTPSPSAGSSSTLDSLCHVAFKKIPFVDQASGIVQFPTAPNGVKLELFVFDCFELATSVVGMEVDRNDEFAAIKNPKGTDSPQTAAQALSSLHRSWLVAAQEIIGISLLNPAGQGLKSGSPSESTKARTPKHNWLWGSMG
eukprot:GHVT01015834.1.p1 GENE.GHVT01015834.1~~GHVT01015834.1.p1  ORF type:complete len:614 (-),score=70.91 GHVT01015834.1:767-2608(-)